MADERAPTSSAAVPGVRRTPSFAERVASTLRGLFSEKKPERLLPLLLSPLPVLPGEGFDFAFPGNFNSFAGRVITSDQFSDDCNEVLVVPWNEATDDTLLDRRGTLCRVQMVTTATLSLQGIARATVIAREDVAGFAGARAALFPAPVADGYDRSSEHWRSFLAAVDHCANTLFQTDPVLPIYLNFQQYPNELPWYVARALALSPDDKRRLLDLDDGADRLSLLSQFLARFAEAQAAVER